MTTYRASPDVLVARLSGETVLLDMRTRNYFQLNSTAARIWDALERGCTVEGLLLQLGEQFDAPVGTLDSEARALLEALLERSLVVTAT